MPELNLLDRSLYPARGALRARLDTYSLGLENAREKNRIYRLQHRQ